jgi:WD40 repeat protein
MKTVVKYFASNPLFEIIMFCLTQHKFFLFLQKVVTFFPDGKLLVTGGTDGCVRMWQYPNFNLYKTLRIGSDPITHIHYNTTTHLVIFVKFIYCLWYIYIISFDCVFFVDYLPWEDCSGNSTNMYTVECRQWRTKSKVVTSSFPR